MPTRVLTVGSAECDATPAHPAQPAPSAPQTVETSTPPLTDTPVTPQLASAPAALSRNGAGELALITLPPQPVPFTSGQPVVYADPIGLRPAKKRRRQLLAISAGALLVLSLSIGYRQLARKPASTTTQPLVSAAVHTDSRLPLTGASAVDPAPAVSVPPPAVVVTSADAKQLAEYQVLQASTSLPTARQQPADPPGGENTIPDYASKPALLHLSALAARRAERCHPHGHAVGSARVFITFAQTGRVSSARIEGEPVASAPVASCILGHVYSIKIPKFDGAPFTFAMPITMR